MAPQAASARRSQPPRVVPVIPRALDKNARNNKPVPVAQPSDTELSDRPGATTEWPPPPGNATNHVAEPNAPSSAKDVTPPATAAATAAEVEPQVNGESTAGPALDQPVSISLDSSKPADLEPAAPPPSTADPPTKQSLEPEPPNPVAPNPEQPVQTSSRPHSRDLPPPFYPSNHQAKLSNAASAQSSHAQQPSDSSIPNPPLSAASLAFGIDRDSSTTSPALVAPQAPSYGQNPPHPHSAASAGPAAGVSLPYGPSHHSYHFSEPHASPFPPHFSPVNNPPHYARDYSTNLNPSQARFYPPTTGRVPQGPRRGYDNQYGARYAPLPPRPPPHNFYQHQAPYHIQQAPLSQPDQPNQPHLQHNLSTETRNDVSRQESAHVRQRPDVSSVVPYLCSQFGHAEFADYILQLSHSGYLFPPTMLPAHGILLARSPKLKSLISMQHSQTGNARNEPRQLSVPISDRFLNLEAALMKALMRLYGDSLPDRDDVTRLASPSAYLEAGNIEAVQMRFALAYAAAGHFLQMDEIISHGLELAANLLSWATVGKALAFGLDGGLSSIFSPIDTSSKDKGSTSSIDDAKLDSPSSAPTYGYYSDRIITNIVNFVVLSCPTDFTLLTDVPQLSDPPRLPTGADPKHSRSTLKLSQIRFGDMTVDDPSPKEPVRETMSSILLSLPYPLLVSILESNILADRLGWNRVAQVMRDVVRERESRRQRASKNLAANGPSSAVEDRLLRSLRSSEGVEPSDRHPGLKLTRQIAGEIETPPSTGSTTN